MGGSEGNVQPYAPCRTACPAGIDVPRYIRQIRNRDFDAALATIRERIPFPSVCGHACVAFCEKQCARLQYDEAVAIRMLKRAAAEYGLDTRRFNAEPTGKKVAVVGSGPSGLTAGYYCTLKGHETTVFEAMSLPGGMLRFGIPAYRLPDEVVQREVAYIVDQGVKINCGQNIESPADLKKQGFDAVLVACGAWKSQSFDALKDDSPRVLDGLWFLAQVNKGQRPSLGQKVVVVGGGNTAIDAARSARRLGAEVQILYRRTRQEMPASSKEIEEALEEGVTITFLTAPICMVEDGLTCVQMVLGEPDKSGRPCPVTVEGTEYTIASDTVIMAIGQSAAADSLGLTAQTNGTVKVDKQSMAVSADGIFAAGDIVSGPSSIIEAIAQGRRAAMSIDMYLGGDGIIDPAEQTPGQEKEVEPEPRGCAQLGTARTSLPERLCGFEITEQGYSIDTALIEASRCLSCDLRHYWVEVNPLFCKACAYCKEVCSLGVFEPSDSFNPSGYRPMQVVNTKQCVGCLNCLYICPDFAIEIKASEPKA
jgi:putative selenate reductase YgfK subunit